MEANGRPLRADAARNRARVLEAARTAFAEAGLDVGVEEIARRAGVGKGTLYRRFPTKEALVRAIFDEVQDEVEVLLAETDRDRGCGGGVRALPQRRGADAGVQPGLLRRRRAAHGRGGADRRAAPRHAGRRRRAARARPAGGRGPRRPRARGRVADAADDRRDDAPRARRQPAWPSTGHGSSGCCSTRCARRRRARSRPHPGDSDRGTERRGTRAQRSRNDRHSSTAQSARPDARWPSGPVTNQAAKRSRICAPLYR